MEENFNIRKENINLADREFEKQLRPLSFDDFRGQKQVIDNLRVLMAGFDGHRGWIYSLAVNPDFRRKGIGSQLMKKAINELKSLGCLKVNLQIEKDNSDVVNFYEKIGFSTEDRISMGMKLY